MKSTWFTNKHCHSLEIKEFRSISDNRVQKSIQINDAVYISGLMARIEKMPADGPIMISFSADAKQIEMLFTSDGGSQKVRIIQGKFQTPSTGFNESNQTQNELYQEIKGLLKD